MNHSNTIVQPSESLFLGFLLSFVGGFLDAYTYISRDHVFANAQTGNIVLLGINIMEKNWTGIFFYLLPICAFISGILLVELIKTSCKQERSLIHWRQIVVACEILFLIIVAYIPIGPKNMIANIIISFVCSMQVESFRTIKGNSISTTMCTGNLRNAAEQLYYGLFHKESSSIKKSFHYFFVIGSFLCGAISGGLITLRMMESAVIFPCILLISAFLLMFKKGESNF